ncbi:hypothetical protein BGZ91_004743 [Linnemannia elongata]|nr:hypothetical protein BGZ91_004743 [Linnemannia elongata]
MSKKTEATSNSSTAAATAAGASAKDAKKQLHSQTNGQPNTNGHSTAHDLENKDAMLTMKKRGDALLRDDEREELMMADRNKSNSNDDDEDGKSKDIAEETSGSLSGADTWNFALLVILYLLQGVPVGLTFGSIPFLLKAKMSYSQIGIFSLAHYPYSMKFLWSPIVDAVYNKDLGRRKSWIVPIQLLTGLMFLWLGMHIEDWMAQEQIAVGTLTVVFFILIFFCATQDIAVDGWALTLLSKENLSYASTAQTIGLNTGYFLSFTVFLAFNSSEFSNKYFRTTPQDVGLVPLGGYLKFWAMMYLAITLWLIFMKKEERTHSDEDDIGIKSVYKIILKIIRLPHMKSFMLVLLSAKIGFIANDAVTALKLLEKGFSKEDLALAVLIDFPFQIIFGYYAVRWSSGARPLKPLLNTLSNFGGTWPRFFVLEAVDYFTVSTCSVVDAKGQDFSCATEPGKTMCQDLAGECVLQQDGYYFVSSICVLLGFLSLIFYIAPTIRYLESLSPKKWKLDQK